MAAYYNEIDPFAAAWLRELIERNLIAPGNVDERSIEDVRPDDLRGYTQCHFFAGIGGWSYALRLAGWPDDRPVWTGSCPCQPFSSAGKRKGTADERHLWPAFFHLIHECRPVTVFGEQVASKDGLAWLDLVQADMEGAGYAIGAVDTCAAGFGAPHIRQRLYWVALGDSQNCGRFQRELGNETGSQCRASGTGQDERRGGYDAPDDGGANWVAHAPVHGRSPAERPRNLLGVEQQEGWAKGENYSIQLVAECGDVSDRMGNNNTGLERLSGNDGAATGRQEPVGQTADAGDAADATMPTNGFWRYPDWLWCRDKKWRPVKSGLSPLADGLPRELVSCSFRCASFRP